MFKSYNDACSLLFNNEFLADVKFQFPNQCFIFAHSFLLSLRGGGFYDAFKESIGAMKLILVEDVSYENFYEYLKCIYKSEKIKLTDKNSLDMFKLSKRYGVFDIEDRSYKHILENIKVANVCEILEISLCEELKPIENKALAFIDRNAKKVYEHPSFEKINQQTLSKIVAWPYSHVDTSEFELFKAVMKWATIACEREGRAPNGYSKRFILGETLKLIRFPAMTAQEFGQCTQIEPHLLEDTEISAIFINITTKQPNTLGFLDYKRFNPGSSPKVTITSSKPNLKISQAQKYSTQFTVTKAIGLSGIGSFAPSGVGSVKLLNQESTEIFTETFNMVNNGYFDKSVFPAVRLEPGKQYELIFEIKETEVKDIHGFKMDYNFPLRVTGDNDTVFTFTKISPNIQILYYNQH